VVRGHRGWLGGLVVSVMLASACSAQPPGGTTASLTTSASAGPTDSPAPLAAPTAFTSPLYRYTMTLPSGWTVFPATSTWDGTSPVGHDDLVVDQLVGPSVTGRCTKVLFCGPVAWAYAAPTSEALATYVQTRDAADARDHPCPPSPKTVEQVTVADGSAVMETKYCADEATGIIVLDVVTIRAGVAYSFYLQDPSHDRGADSADRADFLKLIGTIQLPG
jgi:hypothetical protein